MNSLGFMFLILVILFLSADCEAHESEYHDEVWSILCSVGDSVRAYEMKNCSFDQSGIHCYRESGTVLTCSNYIVHIVYTENEEEEDE